MTTGKFIPSVSVYDGPVIPSTPALKDNDSCSSLKGLSEP